MDGSLARRRAALVAMGLPHGEREPFFEILAEAVRRVTGAPAALLTLIDSDDDRQCFLACPGLSEPWASHREMPLSHSFCRHVMASDSPLVVQDARDHALTAGNPVIEAAHVAAYLGVPVHAGEGVPLGALCALDGGTRDWRARDVGALTALARLASAEFSRRESGGRARDADVGSLVAAVGDIVAGLEAGPGGVSDDLAVRPGERARPGSVDTRACDP